MNYLNKKMRNYTILILLMYLAVSCTNKKSEVFLSTNTSNTLEVSVSASQAVAFDPWLAEISVRNLNTGKTFTVEQEVVIEELTLENLKFKWVSDNKCFVKITQKDGTITSVPIIIQL